MYKNLEHILKRLKFELEFKHRVAKLQQTPRTGSTAQTQEVIGMFIEYDASKGLPNQAMTPTQIMLDFTPQHVKDYEELSKTVLSNFNKMDGNESVMRFVRLCAIEIKFLYGCSATWDGEASDAAAPSTARPEGAAGGIADGEVENVGAPKIVGGPKTHGRSTSRAAAGPLSDGEEGGEADDNELYGEGEDRGGDRFVPFVQHFDPENPLEVDWTKYKYPVPRHFVPRFREAHAIAAMFHLNEDLAAKFPILNGQINEGWQAHYKSPIHVDQIMKPPNTGELAWDDDDKAWLAQTVRYYVSSMSVEQREERGITADKARLLLKGQVQRALPLPLVQGFWQLTNGVLPTPLPQVGTRAAAEERARPLAPRSAGAKKKVRHPHPRRSVSTTAARSAPPPHPRRTVRTPAAPLPHGPHPRRAVRTPAAPPPHGPHPRRTPAARSAPPPHGLHPLRCTHSVPRPHGQSGKMPRSAKRELDEDKSAEDDEDDVLVHKRAPTKRMR